MFSTYSFPNIYIPCLFSYIRHELFQACAVILSPTPSLAQLSPVSVSHFKQQNQSLILFKEIVGRVWRLTKWQEAGEPRSDDRQKQRPRRIETKKCSCFLTGFCHHCCWAVRLFATTVITLCPSTSAVDKSYPSCLCSSSPWFSLWARSLTGWTQTLCSCPAFHEERNGVPHLSGFP